MSDKKIGFIGAGKVGTALGAYFKEKGAGLEGYFSRDFCSAVLAAQKTASRPYLKISRLAADCDIIFITTPDREIDNVWQALKESDLANKLICHTSGALSAAVFSGIRERGGYGYSLHPIFAFPDRSGDTKGLERCLFTIEGDTARLTDMTAFINGFGNQTVVIESADKPLYHAANVLASNLVLGLLAMAEDCLFRAGFNEGQALAALEPLVTANIANVFAKGPAGALTGPVERNDLATVKSNILALPEKYAQVYAGLSVELVKLARAKDPLKDYGELEKLLESVNSGEKRDQCEKDYRHI